MNDSSIFFLFPCVLFLWLVYWASSLKVRQGILTIFSISIAIFLVRWLALAYIALVYICYGLASLLQKKTAHKIKFLWLGLLLFIGALFSVKLLEHTSWALTDTSLWGFSFLCFRLIHLLVDAYRGQLPAMNASEILAYIFFFPTFLAGPLLRFQSFQTQWREKKIFSPDHLLAGLQRILLGLAQKFLIANTIHHFGFPLLQEPAGRPGWQLVLAALFVPGFYLYADFSAYSNIAIGIARTFQIILPENFDKPFSQTNAAAFWKRWHMTLQSFIRDYFFLPVFGGVQTKAGLFMGTICTMILFCIWHRFNWGFFLLGIYYGIGIVGVHQFREWQKEYGHAKILQSGGAKLVAQLLTIGYFGLGMNLFFFDLGGTLKILSAL